LSHHVLGVHVGRGSLRASLLSERGTPIAGLERRFAQPRLFPEAIESAFAELGAHPEWSRLRGACVGLDKGQRVVLPLQLLERHLGEGVPLLTVPAQAAILLGAVPEGPSLLVSLGSELRLAALDSTNAYRDFRLQEGGGAWWTRELVKLARHSPRLAGALQELGNEQRVMKALPRLLERGDFPSPDPVVKARLDGLCATIAESCLGLCSRLPGIKRISFAGFLHPSPMSRRIGEACAAELRVHSARFPAEVGAALLALALHKENEERRHLGKPLETGQLPPGRWEAPPLLVRRLFRLRRPFEDFASRARR
jgi:hypothetical protein